jgi:uncharacterized phage protein (TIGR01671 family)
MNGTKGAPATEKCNHYGRMLKHRLVAAPWRSERPAHGLEGGMRMREIKFRGMAISGEWFYGNLAILSERLGSVEAGSYISNRAGLPFAYRVRPETVGQFTGLRDVNGKEIFEGDILRLQPWVDTYRYVGFANGEYWLYHTQSCFEPFEIGVVISSHEEAEVVGNIYENPELLERASSERARKEKG